MNITQLKQSFELPIKKDEMEYFGPIDHQLSNAFLTMGHDFMQTYFKSLPRIMRKKIFTVFIELIQNIADYNEKYSNPNQRAYVKLTVDNGEIIIKTVNFVIHSDVAELKLKFDKLFKLSATQLKEAYKEALVNGKSLGIIMIRNVENSFLNFQFNKNEMDDYLSFEFRMNKEVD